MTSVKFKYNGEVKKIIIEKETILFNDLVRKAKVIFASLTSHEDDVISFQWTDEDGDDLRCQTDEEIKAAITELKQLGKPLTFAIEIMPVSYTFLSSNIYMNMK